MVSQFKTSTLPTLPPTHEPENFRPMSADPIASCDMIGYAAVQSIAMPPVVGVPLYSMRRFVTVCQAPVSLNTALLAVDCRMMVIRRSVPRTTTGCAPRSISSSIR